MKVQELLIEETLTELTRKSYMGMGFQPDEKFLSGAVGKWLDAGGVTREHIKTAMAQVRSDHELMGKLKDAGLKHLPTAGNDANGTFNFEPSWDKEAAYKVYANGQIRREGNKSGHYMRTMTRMTSLKPRMVSGDPVASLVKTYKAALNKLASKKLNK